MGAVAGRPRNRYTREQRIEMRRRARELRMAGRSYAEIAVEIGVTKQEVSSYIVASLNPRGPGEPLRNLRERANELFAAGHHAVGVARLLNIHQTTSNRLMNEYQNSLAPTA